MAAPPPPPPPAAAAPSPAPTVASPASNTPRPLTPALPAHTNPLASPPRFSRTATPAPIPSISQPPRLAGLTLPFGGSAQPAPRLAARPPTVGAAGMQQLGVQRVMPAVPGTGGLGGLLAAQPLLKGVQIKNVYNVKAMTPTNTPLGPSTNLSKEREKSKMDISPVVKESKVPSAPVPSIAPNFRPTGISFDRERVEEIAATISNHRKVPSAPTFMPSMNYRDSDGSVDERVVVIRNRKVRLLDSESGSLYALCRSWVRNGESYDTQPYFGNFEQPLPRPLPASAVDSETPDEDDREDEVQKEPNGEYSAEKLLQSHINRGKRVRARLFKERTRRIERFKKRLSRLLPPPSFNLLDSFP